MAQHRAVEATGDECGETALWPPVMTMLTSLGVEARLLEDDQRLRVVDARRVEHADLLALELAERRDVRPRDEDVVLTRVDEREVDERDARDRRAETAGDGVREPVDVAALQLGDRDVRRRGVPLDLRVDALGLQDPDGVRLEILPAVGELWIIR